MEQERVVSQREGVGKDDMGVSLYAMLIIE
jgi:hypothetical protein